MAENNAYIAEIIKSEVGAMALEAALAESTRNGVRLLDALEASGHDKERLFEVVAESAGMKTVALTPEYPPAENARLLDAETARRYRVVPLRENLFAIGDPTDLETLDTLRYLFADPVEWVAAPPERIGAALDRLYPVTDAGMETLVGLMDDHREEGGAVPNEIDDAEEPVIKLVNLLIQEAHKARASDIHLEPLSTSFRVRYRIDGALREVEGPPRRLHPAVVSRVKIMAGMKISEKRLPQDGRVEIRVMGRSLDLRVSTIPSNHGESVVMRLLDKENLALGLAHLGFGVDDQQRFEGLIRQPDGVVLITGPTGSGKTTSLYACLNHLNQPDRKIITVEDPVEYQLAGVNQVRVRPDIGLTFATALRSMLRQAPNIIMVGEIRDKETADIAINAALTGHLVLSTLHTNDAPSAVTRLTDIGVKPFLVASSLRGVLAQRLVRTICPSCGSDRESTTAERALAGNIATLRVGAGCPACGGTGYHGRVGLFELMNVDDELRRSIHDGATAAELRATARARGMRTLREDGVRKAIDGVTTLDETLRVTLGDAC